MNNPEAIDQTLGIVEEARKRGVTLRLAGGMAVRIHSHDYSGLLDRLLQSGGNFYGPKDVDMVTYRSQREDVHKLFIEFGFKPNKLVMAYFGEDRFNYQNPNDLYEVDVFFEKLKFSHEIDLGTKIGGSRLELDYPTLSPADLLLEKIQIHDISEKDIIDIIVLLRAHEVSDTDLGDSINNQRIGVVLSQDWGFWYDAKSNLESVKTVSEKYLQINHIEKEDLDDVIGKIDKILDYVDSTPKTSKWLRRSKDGTKRKWWRDVEELVR
jgi:hypothetical protein